MANNRPINRRPWRRPPWRKAARPFRWVELNCAQLDGPCTSTAHPVVCASEDPADRTDGVRELWAGDFDAEYADDGSVVLERIVGSITLGGISLASEGQYQVPYVRLGLLAVEEVDNIATWADNGTPDLFSREDLEEFQWLWLYGTQFKGNWVPTGEWEAVQGMRYGVEIPLDLRVKRKLGKKDSLVLISQFATQTFVGSISVQYWHTLRGGFTTK